MISLLHNNLLWTEGFYIFLTLIGCNVAAFIFYRPLLIVTLGLLIFSIYFFRNPDRVCIPALSDPNIIICPADGKVVDIHYNAQGNLEGFHHKISIFLSPFDVHVNWAPVGGIVEAVRYKPGTFTMAFLPKSSLLNERNDIHILSNNGKPVMVRQIAGTVARRICCWVHEGQSISAGYKIGMIRFGSRVDIFLPSDAQIQVGIGQRVYGGQTVLGRWQ